MHTELYCRTLEILDPVKAIRAIHEALLQLQAASVDDGRVLDHTGAIASLRACLGQAGHVGFNEVPA